MHVSVAQYVGFLGALYEYVSLNTSFIVTIDLLQVGKCIRIFWTYFVVYINPLKPNDSYRGRTAPLTSKRCILYIYSTNIGTECFKHGIYSPFFSS